MICEACNESWATRSRLGDGPHRLCFACRAVAKALLERDIAEVTYHVRAFDEHTAGLIAKLEAYNQTHPRGYLGFDPETRRSIVLKSLELATLRAEIDDCRRWLERSAP